MKTNIETLSPAMQEVVKPILSVICDNHDGELPDVFIKEEPSSTTAHIDKCDIILTPTVLDMPDEVAKGTVAYLVAHAALGHCQLEPDPTQGERAEEQARKWGFDQEIDALRKHSGKMTESHS